MMMDNLHFTEFSKLNLDVTKKCTRHTTSDVAKFVIQFAILQITFIFSF